MESRQGNSASKKSLKRPHDDSDDSFVSDPEVSETSKKTARKKRRSYKEKEAEAIAYVKEHPLVPREFTSRDVDFLSKNEHDRYLDPSKVVGHVVLKEGSDQAEQYDIPAGEEEETPTIVKLHDIEAIERKGKEFFRAKAPDGTKMFATRFLDGAFDNTKFRVACFSPLRAGSTYAEPFYGEEDVELPVFRTDMSEGKQKDHDNLVKDIMKKGPTVKGGEWLVVDPVSVQIRDQIGSRSVQQGQVMGESSVNAFEGFLEHWKGSIPKETQKVFKKIIEAPLRGKFYSQPRGEWLHAYGHSLVPMELEPQKEINLGAAPKWANTEMMVLERIVKWFVLNQPDVKAQIRPFFEMILDSEIIRKIEYAIQLEQHGHTFKLEQFIDPIKLHHLFRKPTDLMQGTAIAFSMLNELPPSEVTSVKRVSGKLKSLKTVVEGSTVVKDAAKTQLKSLKSKSSQESEKPEVKAPEVKVPEAKAPVAKAPVAKAPAALVKKTTTPVEKEKKVAEPVPGVEKKEDSSSEVKYDRSVMQIEASSVEYDYDNPWNPGKFGACYGSAWVIEHEGRKYIMTNAHVVENATFLTARFADNREKKYIARVKQVSYQCDLAILEVDDEEFQQKAQAVVLGDMVKRRDPVLVVGFPMGGSEANFSEGIVSRIEVGEYSMSGQEMLAIGVSAAINSGNSGGPVFSNNKVVGVAFQGYVSRQGLGFMIPVVIVKHFLQEVFSGKPYRGFPVLPFDYQPLENPTLAREICGLKEGQSGVRLRVIHPLSDVANKLKIGDVLLKIDGLTISNEGTVDIPNVGKVLNMLHVMHSKFIGDTVTFNVLRKNEITQEFEELEIPVVLDCVPLDTTKIGPAEHDKPPTYFIYAGMCFEKLTANFIEDSERSDLEKAADPITGLDIYAVPKTTKDEEMVVINDVWACTQTRGYEHMINCVIKEANGKKINNMRDLVRAIEGNQGNYHKLVTGGGSIIALPKITAAEKAIIFGQHGVAIDKDRSPDLKDILPEVDAMDIDEPVAPPVAIAAVPVPVAPLPAPSVAPLPSQAPALQVVKPTPVQGNSAAILKMLAPKSTSAPKPAPKPVVDSSEEELMPDFEFSDDVVDEKTAEKAGEILARGAPGKRKFEKKIAEMSAQYPDEVWEAYEDGRLVESGADEEDDIIDVEDLGEGSEESDESTVELQPRRHSMFSRPRASSSERKPATKRPRDEQDEDQEEKERVYKRLRRGGL